MNWLTAWLERNPEYRGLRTRKTANSIHFEIAPGIYEAHFWIDRRFARTSSGLWLPFSRLSDSLRVASRLMRAPGQAAAFAALLPFGTVTTIQPDASAGEDTRLLGSTNGDKNYGTATTMQLGGNDFYRRALIRFNLSSIPSTAVVSSAVLSLYYVTGFAGIAANLVAYELTDAAKGWVEGTQNGVAAAGETCWNYLKYNTTNWPGSAGCSTSGTDYETSSIGSTAISLNSSSDVDITLTANRSLRACGTRGVRLSYSESDTNVSQAFGTSDNATAAKRPKLVMTYTVPTGGAPFNRPFSNAFRGPFGE